jgi:hypothetical protein
MLLVKTVQAVRGSGVFLGQTTLIMACRLAEKDFRPRKVRRPTRMLGFQVKSAAPPG